MQPILIECENLDLMSPIINLSELHGNGAGVTYGSNTFDSNACGEVVVDDVIDVLGG